MKKLPTLTKVDDTTEDRQYRLGYNDGIDLQLHADKRAVEKCREKIAKKIFAYMWVNSWRQEESKALRFTDQIIKIILKEE